MCSSDLMVGWGLIDFHHIRAILRVSRQESAVLITTLLATLFVELEFAIYFGVILSLMLYLNRTSHPVIRDVKPDTSAGSYHFSADTGLPDCPQLKMLRVNGSLFFGAVNHVQQALQRIDEHAPRQKHVLLAASGVNFVDIAGAELLADVTAHALRTGLQAQLGGAPHGGNAQMPGVAQQGHLVDID